MSFADVEGVGGEMVVDLERGEGPGGRLLLRGIFWVVGGVVEGAMVREWIDVVGGRLEDAARIG